MRFHLLTKEEAETATEGEITICGKCSAETVFKDGRWQCLNPECTGEVYHKEYRRDLLHPN